MPYKPEILDTRARSAFTHGHYQSAIKYYTAAIHAAPSAERHHARAVCYQKLKQYQAALQDAKRAIGLDPKNPTYWLWASNICAEIKKQRRALDLAKTGLTIARPSSATFEKLREAYRELMLHFRRDPLKNLPHELQEHILSYLPFAQMVLRVSPVSKLWLRQVRSFAWLWRHLDLSEARRNVRLGFISRAINVTNATSHMLSKPSRLKSATLHNVKDMEKALGELLRRCPIEDLTFLDPDPSHFQRLAVLLRNAEHIKSLRFGDGTCISPKIFAMLLEGTRATLQSLDVALIAQGPLERLGNPYERLHFLRITTIRFTQDFLDALPVDMPNLRNLTLHETGQRNIRQLGSFNLTDCNQLEDLCIRSENLSTMRLTLPKTIVRLSLHPSHIEPPYWRTDPLPVDFYFDLPRLQELSIAGATGTPPILPMTFLGLGDYATMSSLKSVNLSFMRTSSEGVNELIAHPRLSRLESAAMCERELDDSNVETICQHWRNLRRIDLSGTHITGIGLKMLAALPHLQEVTANDCERLSRDAVDWARSQGLAVVSRKTRNDLGGRKVFC